VGIGALAILASPNDIAELDLAGGSGYGDPLVRPLEAVQSDLDGGYVTPEGARRDYGCVVGDDGRIDAAASEALRSGKVAEFEPAE
jgi:N-methylhydantoinase B/oxoprolinase/acetone carboxylase alpha subunit